MEKKLLLGNNLEKLKELEDNSIDSIVTDPPYGLSFMNKKWDYDVPSVEFWKEILRVLKPGGHLLSFGGTRTYHRMTVNIEDAGFEIRDCIQWLYGSGFPKSHNIGKAIDKINGETGRLIKFVEWYRTTGMKQKETNNIINKSDVGSHYLRLDQPAIPTKEIWEILRPHIKCEIPKWVDELIERIEKEREIIGKTITNKTIYQNIGDTNISGEVDITKGNSEWEGWGTALKPANEPIVLARKPLEENTVAENVLKYRTGGINIDDSRIGIDIIKSNGYYNQEDTGIMNMGISKKSKDEYDGGTHQGRFPANIILDEIAAEELDKQSGINKSSKFPKSFNGGFGGGQTVYGDGIINKEGGYNNEGGASRFFHTVKLSEEEVNLDKTILNEPIVLARKPLEENTVAENVLKYRTGGINIDDSRIGTDDELARKKYSVKNDEGRYNWNNGDDTVMMGGEGHSGGRFPANIILDEIAAEELDKQSGVSKSSKSNKLYNNKSKDAVIDYGCGFRSPDSSYGDEGGASRFFYIAKVSKKERNLGIDKNIHPTVKPISLMYYLCKLITPPNGTILDPYMGSGSTGIASQLGGFNFVGMEMEEEYFNIAQSRINHYEEYRQFLKK